MDFGKLTDISGVDFGLSADPVFTKNTLQNYQSPPHKQLTPLELGINKPQIYVGPPIWANKEWTGKIYPNSAKEKDFLYHFARQFNTIELNVTHYQVPNAATIERWREAVTPDFRFCPKWPQEISHERQLLGCEPQTEAFMSAVLGLEKNLGTTFLQLAPYFGPWKFDVLEKFLRQILANFPLAVEFRHPKWFEEPVWTQTLELLSSLGVGTVMSDVAGRRDVLHLALTTPALMLRFVGNELHPTDFSRVNEWAKRLKTWIEAGLQTATIFVHCGENIFAPELSKYWIEQLNQECGLTLKAPVIQPKVVQGSLF